MQNKDPKTTIYRCPSCGAPITFRDDDGICDYCGTIVRRQHNQPNAEPVVIYRGTVPAAKKPPTRSNPLGCIIITIAVVSIAIPIVIATGAATAIVAAIMSMTGQSGIPAIIDTTRVADVVANVPRDSDVDDLIVYLYQDSDIVLGRIEGSSRTLLWKSAILSSDGRNGQVGLDADSVYYVDRERLYAVSLADGTPRWEASLVAELNTSCDNCLQVVGDRVVALQKDGSLQGFDTADGRMAWNMRLNDAREIVIVGDQVAVAHAGQGSDETLLSVIDPADGNIAWETAPTCQRDDQPFAMSFRSSDTMFVLAGDLLLLYGSPYPCAQRWTPGSITPQWETFLPEDAQFGFYQNTSLSSEKDLYVTIEHGILRIDTAGGGARVVIEDEEQVFFPVAMYDDILILKTAPTWDLQKQSLWGVDSATGERRWQFALEADEWLRDSGFGEWDARAGADSIIVVQVPDEPARLIVERLDPQTGTVLETNARDLDDSSKVVWGYYWTNQTGWLIVGTELVSISLRDGSVTTVRR